MARELQRGGGRSTVAPAFAGQGSGYKVVRDLRIAVDIGGTFTDVVLEEGGRRLTRKLLTTPQRPEEAVLDGVRLILADAGAASATSTCSSTARRWPPTRVIERRGARTALIATEGFRDMLDIANESRYDQYDLTIEKPKPLVPRALRFTVPERIDVHGKVRLALDEARRARARARAAAPTASKASPSAFMHSYANPAHERRTRADPEGRAARPLDDAVERGLPRGARIRAHLDGGRQRLCAAADGWLSRAHGTTALPVEQFRGAIYLVTSGGGLTADRDGAALSGAPGRDRARPAARFSRRRSRRAPARRRRCQLRHGWHHGQDLPDRRTTSRTPRGCSRSIAPRAS